MKRKSSYAFPALCFFFIFLAGCNKSGVPVVPANSAVLKLSVPAFVLNSKPSAASSKNVHASDAVPDSNTGRLKYCITTPGEIPVKGSVDFASGSDVGTVTITLPKSGKWVVAAEWFLLFNPNDALLPGAVKAQATVALTERAEFAGADEVDVEGTTSATIAMEDIDLQESGCYNVNLTDPTDEDFNLNGNWVDLYSFNSGNYANSVTEGGPGDIQASFDVATSSTYFISPSAVPIYAYLGNGDFVDFAVIPNNAIFYTDTIKAKSAVTGQAGSILAGNDIFVVKIPSTNGMAWVRFNAPNIGFPLLNNSAFEQFFFIYNNEGLNYMKFDETTNGSIGCNQNNLAG